MCYFTELWPFSRLNAKPEQRSAGYRADQVNGCVAGFAELRETRSPDCTAWWIQFVTIDIRTLLLRLPAINTKRWKRKKTWKCNLHRWEMLCCFGNNYGDWKWSADCNWAKWRSREGQGEIKKINHCNSGFKGDFYIFFHYCAILSTLHKKNLAGKWEVRVKLEIQYRWKNEFKSDIIQ